MKKLNLLLGTFILISLIAMNGCKKGENDPFISLKSRDARITGEWELTSIEGESIEIEKIGTDVTTTTTITTYNGTIITTKVDGTVQSTFPLSLKYVIEKDGAYSMTVVIDGDKSETKDNWHWIDSKKNKTIISLDDEYYIDQLKNKEMVLKYESYYKDTNSDGNYDEETTTTTMTFTKK